MRTMVPVSRRQRNMVEPRGILDEFEYRLSAVLGYATLAACGLGVIKIVL